jgi:signal transduction histidine kinase
VTAPDPSHEPSRRRLLAFLRKLPHDFANAILPFQIASDLLRRADGDPAVVRQVQHILEQQSGQASRLVEALERTSRVLRGELELHREPCDLGQVVGAGIDGASRRSAGEADIELVAPASPITIDVDRRRLAAAVEELVDNATRFAGGPVRVELALDGDDAVVRVSDGGPGIPAERLQSLYEPFTAAEAVESGWGIGLGFARLVAAAHGGSLDGAAGAGGAGLVMTLRLPR